ncbi:Pimeloyl-ACP methyl ester carboxylesterase [Granulicella rosea]|uniref:Pimeloyl-ACP methyl ester carboxylesterase n=1 Tax=Granulicella rosea TaxID=474952 RepID=A0A239J8Z9_9BACT|nr:Pimeloyl-ACP methyl ester carboxylesterase [Granulicella rosea]
MGARIERRVKELCVVVDGVRLNYLRSGSGPALVLLHGLVGSARNWQQNIESLSREATVYALDLPNMGESERVLGLDASQAATADYVAKWMDAVGLADADVCGHSHGGAVSLMLASRHPEKVRRLVLFAPANPFCDSGRHLIRFYRSAMGSRLARMIPHLPRFVHHTALGRMYGDPGRVRAGALEAYTRNLNRGSLEHVLQIVRRWGVDMKALHESLARQIDVPVLLVWGDADRAVSFASSAKLREFLPQSSLFVLPGVGHLPFEEMPEVSNRAVREWLRTGEILAARATSTESVAWDREAVRA